MLNTVSLIGNLGQDPDVRYTQAGLAIANLSLAVSEHYKDASGESQKRTHWFRATAFGRTAEIASEYCQKGSKVGVSGTLITREWTDKDQQQRASTEIRINQLELLTPKADGSSQHAHTQQPQRPQTQQRQQPQQYQNEPPPYGDDEIPF